MNWKKKKLFACEKRYKYLKKILWCIMVSLCILKYVRLQLMNAKSTLYLFLEAWFLGSIFWIKRKLYNPRAYAYSKWTFEIAKRFFCYKHCKISLMECVTQICVYLKFKCVFINCYKFSLRFFVICLMKEANTFKKLCSIAYAFLIYISHLDWFISFDC